MKRLYRNNIYIALIHHPVLNKKGDVIASAVTNLDLHDIARVAKTYGVKGFYVVTPLEDQIKLVNKIVEHWLSGFGYKYNFKRSQALKLVRVSSSYNSVLEEVFGIESCMPKTVATTARFGFKKESYTSLRCKISDSSEPYILAFGTAWGLTDTFLFDADCILGPIRGFGKYNHLSVRSAVAIILDRLLSVD